MQAPGFNALCRRDRWWKDAENAAKPKPVFTVRGLRLENSRGDRAVVMLLSGTVLPWEGRSNVSSKRRPTKPQQSQCRLNVFSRGS